MGAAGMADSIPHLTKAVTPFKAVLCAPSLLDITASVPPVLARTDPSPHL